MKYYRLCQKILGRAIFSELIETLLNKIIEKFGKEISIDEFVKVLEINIDAIIMLGLSITFPNRKKSILEELKNSIPYIVSKTLDEFERDMEYYIKMISQKLEE